MFLFSFIASVLPFSLVFASDISNAEYYGIIRIVNNSTAATNITSNITNIKVQTLIDSGYITAANATNLALRNSAGTDIPFQPGYDTNTWMMWVDSISENGIDDYTFYASGITGGSIRYFPLPTGNMTVLDDPSMEPGSDWEIEIKGWINTAGGTNQNILAKGGAVKIYVASAGNITFNTIFGGGATASVGGVSSGEHTVKVAGDGVNIYLYLDDALEDTVAYPFAIADIANDWISFDNGVMPYVEYQKITVSGTLVCHIEWEYGTTFTDLSGNGNDATPDFAVDSSDADVTASLVSFGPTEEATAPSSSGTATLADWIITPNLTTDFRDTITPTAPGSEIVSAIAAASSTPSQLPFFLISGFVILVISLCMTYAMKKSSGTTSYIVKCVAMACLMGISVATSVFDWWMPLLWALPVIAMGFASKPTGVV